MALSKSIKAKIKQLKAEFEKLRKGKESLLTLIDEAEVPECVYNSNAIENSTLTLKDTERILLDMEVSRDFTLREVFEAKNLARVMEYISAKGEHMKADKPMILLLHQMLIGGINDGIAGRFRGKGEYVRVGTHIAPPPEKIEPMLDTAFASYVSEDEFVIDRVAGFHLDFETIHPFNDGNGRIGRVLMNIQLSQAGFPTIIIRDKEKKKYYEAFKDFRGGNSKTMEKVVSLALMESFHKRIAYLQGEKIINLADFAKLKKRSIHTLLNAARRQTIPAFREKGAWKIGESFSG